MAGGAQAKMSTWFSKPNQSLISKVTKKRVGFNLKIIVFALLKTVEGFRGGTTQICLENEDIEGSRKSSKVIRGITSVK